MSLVQRTMENLVRRREKVLNGGINSIPPPFKRFSNDFIGLEPAKMYVVTAATKVGKTTFASYLFIYNSLLFAYNNPDKVRFKVFYIPREETPEDVLHRFMCFILYKLSKGKVIIDRNDLKSSKNVALDEKVLELLNSEEYKNILDFFEENVMFYPSVNPSGVWKEMIKYAEDHGKVYKRKIETKDEFGFEKEIEVFDHYVPDDDNEIRLIFDDHVSLTPLERNFTLKQAIDKLGEYYVLLRNMYGYSICEVHQQNTSSESLDAIKLGKAKASTNFLADSSYSGRNCDVCIGVNSPFRQELPDWNGYDITKLKDYFRYVEILLNRSGSAGGVAPLFYLGKVCDWNEMPLPKEVAKLNEVYSYVEFLNDVNKPKSFFIYKLKKRVKNLFK